MGLGTLRQDGIVGAAAAEDNRAPALSRRPGAVVVSRSHLARTASLRGLKSEDRRPKAEGRPKTEIRNNPSPDRLLTCQPGGRFGLRVWLTRSGGSVQMRLGEAAARHTEVGICPCLTHTNEHLKQKVYEQLIEEP